jgi:hypothetical protein
VSVGTFGHFNGQHDRPRTLGSTACRLADGCFPYTSRACQDGADSLIEATSNFGDLRISPDDKIWRNWAAGRKQASDFMSHRTR